jgi:hypothetical protein
MNLRRHESLDASGPNRGQGLAKSLSKYLQPPAGAFAEFDRKLTT